MDDRDRFRSLLKADVGPALRLEGFTGSGNTWRSRNNDGDWGIVNVQKSAWGSADEVSAYINLAILPRPVWEFKTWAGQLPAASRPSAHHGFWQRRLDPPGTSANSSWDFSGSRDQPGFGKRLTDALRSDGVPGLKLLLHRPTFLSRLEAHGQQFDGGHAQWPRDMTRLVFLVDDGPSMELTAALNSVETTLAEDSEGSFAYLRPVLEWARARSAG